MLVRQAGVVKHVGQMVEIRLLSGQRVFAPRKNVVVGQKVDIVFNVTNKCLFELKEMLRKGGFAEALLFCYDPDADYSPDEFVDFGALEPSCERFWSAETGVIKVEWFEPDDALWL